MTRGSAALAISQGLSVWVMEAPEGFGDAASHSHHAIQITASLRGYLRLSGLNGAAEGAALAVKAGARHSLDASGTLAMVFLEPESSLGRKLDAALFQESEIMALGPEMAAALAPLETALRGAPDRKVMLQIGRQALSQFEPVSPSNANEVDPRIRRIIDHAAENLDRPVSLIEAARGIYLSPSRLRHLFVEQTGLPFKTYLLWLRLVRALETYSSGSSLTEAAHLAGFSDSAHFSRTFRRTFGLPATTLTRI